MELSWSTFLLEIVNFLVLVWILKRFLYRPVLNIIAKRRKDIENQLAESRQLHEQASASKAEYENRLSEWELERQQLRDQLVQELDSERARQMEALQSALAQEREKSQVIESRKQQEIAREAEYQALQQAARFASRLLSMAAGPELEVRLLDLLLEGLSTLSEDQISALRSQWGAPPKSVTVTSTFPLPEDRRQQLEKIMTTVTGLDVPVTYAQDQKLLAGLRVTVGAWVLHANLQHELKGFAEFTHAIQ